VTLSIAEGYCIYQAAHTTNFYGSPAYNADPSDQILSVVSIPARCEMENRVAHPASIQRVKGTNAERDADIVSEQEGK
jgi:hypothetical protein